MIQATKYLLQTIALLLALLVPMSGYSADHLSSKLDKTRAIQQKKQEIQAYAQKRSQIPVIVRLSESSRLSKQNQNTGATALKNQTQRHRDHFQRLFSTAMKQGNAKQYREFNDARMRSLTVDEDELDRLLADPSVEVYPNRIHTVSLTQSVPLVFPNQGASDYTGQDQRVILIDTGVDQTHSFLNGAVDTTQAACFSNDGNVGGLAGHFPASESLCPGGATSSIGTTSGQACDSTLTGCNHGTQMAGIIAGQDASSNGVAPDARVVPIQVFTKINDFEVCNSLGLIDPCIGATTSDLLAALEYVRTNLNQSNVAAVNISFGTSFTSQGQCDSSLESTIQQIVSNGIAVVASSGNGGSDLAMTSPACIDGVVSVASTSISNAPSVFNNRNSELDFFAPGEGITTSTLPANQFADVQDVPAGGTSAAAAHISGAWAVMKSKNTNARVSLVKSTLENTGVAVTQTQGTPVTAPRILLDQALVSLPEPVEDDDLCVPIRTTTGKVALICL